MTQEGDEVPSKDLTSFSQFAKSIGSDEALPEHASIDAPIRLEDPFPLETVDSFEPIQATGVQAEPEAEAQPDMELIPKLSVTPAQDEISLPPPLTPTGTMTELKEFADRVPIGTPSVSAAYPFSLSITGMLKPEEREKLVDLMNRESMGIREVDLDPQFEAGRVLIPRISEYAGVLITQALRGITAEIRLLPADSIFSTEDTLQDTSLPVSQKIRAETLIYENPPTAESLPITSLDSLPEMPNYWVVDIVTASAALTTRAVEAERTTEYQELLEALQRELKYKAFRKGATAILNFSVNLTQLSGPTHYRLTALGSAVRKGS